MTFDQQIQLAIAIGTCFSAVATSAAVIYSLVQTRHATRSRLKLHAVLTKHPGQPDFYGDPTQSLPALKIQISNRGQTSIYLTAVGWKSGRLFSRITQSQNMTDGWPLPCKVDRAEYATFWIAPNEWDQWLEAFAKEVLKPPQLGHKPYLRLAAITSLGEEITAKVSADVYAELTRHYTASL